jgi:hypothetical protein
MTLTKTALRSSLASNRMHWLFEDPAKFMGTEEEKLAKFREVRDLIEKKIKTWVPETNISAQPGIRFALIRIILSILERR